jgi:hypothetical protein
MRVLDRFDIRCGIKECRAEIRAGDRWICDHVIALINGGANRESNLQPLCHLCARRKDISDVSEKSRSARIRAAHFGQRQNSRPLPCGKKSAFKRKIGGEIVRR